MSTESDIAKGNIFNKEIFISANIEYLRKKNRLTQEKLGEMLGYTYTTIGNWEKGIRTPDAVDIVRLSRIFNVTTDDLLTKKIKINEIKQDD